jgi:O-antigen/teichoic acid export membrane protein
VDIALGGEYDKSAPVLRSLAPYIFLVGFGPLVSVSANYLGEARRRVPIAIVTVALNFVLDLVLVPQIGVLGGAIGTDVAYTLYAPAHLLLCQRILGFDLRPIAKTFLRTLIAGGAMTGILLLVGGSLAEAWRIPLGGVAGIGAFVLALRLTGEIRKDEISSLLASAPLLRRLSRGRGGPR